MFFNIWSLYLVRMKYFLYLICFFFVSIKLAGQQRKIDSLWVEYNATEINKIKCQRLVEIVDEYYYVDMDKAIFYNDSLLSISKGVSLKHEACAYRMKGTLFLIERKFEESKRMYDKSLEMAEEINEKALQARIFSNLAVYYSYKEDNVNSEAFHLKAIRVNSSIGRDDLNINSYMNLGILNTRKQLYKQSIEYLLKGNQIADSINDVQNAAFINNQIAVNYLQLNQFEKSKFYLARVRNLAQENDNAIAFRLYYNTMGYLLETQGENSPQILLYYDSSLVFAKKLNHSNNIQKAYANIGQEYIRLRDYKKADEHLTSALKICQETNNTEGESIVLLQLGRLAIQKGNVAKGIQLVKDAKEKIGDGYADYPDLYYQIAESLADAGEYKLAFEELNAYSTLTNSVFENNSSLRIASVERKYESDKKQREIIQYKSKQTNRIRILVGSILALLFLLGIFAFYYRRNKKQKDKIVILQKELHHRVENNLAIIDEFIDKSTDGVQDKVILENLSELQSRVGSINQVHTLLYQDNDVTAVNLNRYLHGLVEQVKKIYDKQAVQIRINCDREISLATNQSVHFGLIVNEFLTNSFKYAFAGIDNPVISIEVTKMGNKLEMKMKDNGIGFDPKKVDGKSYGTHIMGLLANKLNAIYNISGSDGTVLNLQLVIN